MKKLLSFFAILLFSLEVLAQAPQAMSYQAIIKDTNGKAVANTSIGMRISILQGSKTGNVVYQEMQAPTTNANGLINIQIGSGIPTAGKFEKIDYSKGPYYIETETNLAGGTNFNDPHQQTVVSYALYAHGVATEETPVGAKGEKKGPHYVGEIYGGGIIFYVNKESDGTEHGLIAALTDLSTACIWSNVSTLIGSSSESTFNGRTNTKAIIAQEDHKKSAALLCDTCTLGGQNDWYLPSMQELNMLWNSLNAVNRVLDTCHTCGAGAEPIAAAIYWSSTEDDATTFAWYFGMYDAGPDGDTAGTNYKSEMYHVRAIRQF